jgi:hypothetical protein
LPCEVVVGGTKRNSEGGVEGKNNVGTGLDKTAQTKSEKINSKPKLINRKK